MLLKEMFSGMLTILLLGSFCVTTCFAGITANVIDDTVFISVDFGTENAGREFGVEILKPANYLKK